MNTMTRKQFGRIALAAGLALGMGTVASAQDGYPNKPITMVVPASAGGTTDLAARMTAQALGPVLGQTLVVENKGGGNGNIADAVLWLSCDFAPSGQIQLGAQGLCARGQCAFGSADRSGAW